MHLLKCEQIAQKNLSIYLSIYLSVWKRLSVNLPRNALLTTYKSFIRPHLDYGDILYEKANNENFQNKIEKVQYRLLEKKSMTS